MKKEHFELKGKMEVFIKPFLNIPAGLQWEIKKAQVCMWVLPHPYL
jgi:hypothetical protein